MRLLSLAVAASLSLSPTAGRGAADGPGGEPTGIGVFSRHDKFSDVKLSPKGTYLAAVTYEGGRRSLAFLNLKTRQLASVLKPDGESMVGTFQWVNDERVVIELVDRGVELAAPVSRGELYAVDASGRGGRMVFGYRAGEMQTGSHLQRGGPDFAWARVLGTLRGDERRVLIEAREMGDAGDRVVRVFKLDVYTGVKTFVTASPIREASFLTDEDGEPRIASALDAQLQPRFFHRAPGADWRELATVKGLTRHSVPIRFASRERTIYVGEPTGGGFGLYAVSLDTGERKLLSRHDKVPPRAWVWDGSTRRFLALEYEPDLPSYEFLDAAHPISRAMKGLLATYPDDHVRLESTTDDDRKAVVKVFSDRNPGQFLLVDVEKLSAEPIVGVRPWVRPDGAAEMNAFHITVSDGFRIHGYLTLPRATQPGAAPPLVVLPHGGPHGVRDEWGYVPEVQLLASEGFAVLQVNYRGSGGYGRQYQEAGYRKWGDRVVQDVVEATRWAISRGYADPARICIYGGSFGGYAALQGAILAPDLYRCAVGYSGIYDLALLTESGDIGETSLGRGFVRTAVGDDAAALKRASPVHNAAAIRADVLLIHGKKDERAPFEHAEKLRRALVEQGKRPELLVEPEEGHGFYDEAARERMYTRLLGFLREHTRAEQGKRATAAP